MLTQERLQQIARKLRTYIEIYPGDKEARAMADDCERAAAVGANVGADETTAEKSARTIRHRSLQTGLQTKGAGSGLSVGRSERI